MPAKSSTLSLVEDEPQEESNLGEPEQEQGHPLEQAVVALSMQVRELEDRLVRAEQLISSLGSLAHSEHQIELGSNELSAIGRALQKQTQETIFSVLKEHYGFAPPHIRGDA